MQKPFILINGKLTKRKEFDITEGFQPTYAFLYIKSGSFSLSKGEKKQVIHAGDAIIFSDSERFIRSVNKEIEFIYVKFKLNTNCSFLPTLPTGKIDFKDKKRFLSSITAYEKLLHDLTPQSVYVKEHLFEDILLQISSEHSTFTPLDNAMTNDQILDRAIKFLDQNLNKKVTIEQLCKACATNPSTLNFRFRRAFNCSSGEYIITHKLANAKKLLLTSNYSISEISMRVGFENQYYFSTAFKKKEGISPSTFRKKQGI